MVVPQVLRLEGPRRGRKAGIAISASAGKPYHIGISSRVHGDASAVVKIAFSEVARIDQTRAGWVHSGDESVSYVAAIGRSAEFRLEGINRGETIIGRSPDHERGAGMVHGNGVPLVALDAAPEQCGVNKRSGPILGGVDLGHEGFATSREGPRSRGEITREAATCHVGVASIIHSEHATVAAISGNVPRSPSQVGRVQQRSGAFLSGVELRYENVSVTRIADLVGALGDRKIGRPGVARHIDIAGEVHSNPSAIRAREIGRINKPAAGRIQLGNKGLGCRSVECSLEGSSACREVIRPCAARHIGVPGSVHGNRCPIFPTIIPASAEVGGIHQPGPRGIQLGHEGAGTRIAVLVVVAVVTGPSVGRLVTSLSSWKARTRGAREISVAASIHGYVHDVIGAEEGRVDKPGTRGIQFRDKRARSRGSLERSRSCREVGGVSLADYVCISCRVHSDIVSPVGEAAAP